jgi:hypothetical protein
MLQFWSGLERNKKGKAGKKHVTGKREKRGEMRHRLVE